MAVKFLNKPIFTVCIALAALSATGQTNWRFPIAIEALQDIPALAAETGGQKRGVLYVGAGESFTIRKGQRFLMVKAYGEGVCQMRFERIRCRFVSLDGWLYRSSGGCVQGCAGRFGSIAG
jgi:hypothetical protein